MLIRPAAQAQTNTAVPQAYDGGKAILVQPRVVPEAVAALKGSGADLAVTVGQASRDVS